jgi:hypothetical protein
LIDEFLKTIDGALRVAFLDQLQRLTPETIGVPVGSAARRCDGRRRRKKNYEEKRQRSVRSRVDFVRTPSHNSRAFEHG